MTSVINFVNRSRAGVRARTVSVTLPLVTLFAVVWLVSLSRSLFDPPGFDHALYQYITERVMAGDRMYVDVWDQNSPGIIPIHWLATHLFGRSPIGLRLFDASWQLLTVIALITLAGRDGRRWRAGWLAATLYTLAYYGTGYVNTAQRDGFAVLPLILAVHAVAPTGTRGTRGPFLAARHFLGGGLAFIAFALKPPLGLCFAALWLLSLTDAWRRRREGLSACTAIVSLSAGFLLSVAASVVILIRLDWWAGFWPVLTRQDVPGYIRGPELLRELMPFAAIALPVIAIIALVLARQSSDEGSRWTKQELRKWPRMIAVGMVVFLLMVSLQQWRAWGTIFLALAGILLPALGVLLLGNWRERSRIWQATALLAAASLAAVVWQGRFYQYHLPPLLAFCAYIVGHELIRRSKQLRTADHPARMWAIVCLAGVVHLAVTHWGSTMTFATASPCVLADTTLSGHYARITKHKTRFPDYATSSHAAHRVRFLTDSTDPIACLIDEPRIYYLAQRPCVSPLIRTQSCYRHKFPALFEAIEERRPKVVLARVPEPFRESHDRTAITATVFDAIEDHFGPSARRLRSTYRITEIINNDVCILQPVERPPLPTAD